MPNQILFRKKNQQLKLSAAILYKNQGDEIKRIYVHSHFTHSRC
jgi:hypothetical protein